MRRLFFVGLIFVSITPVPNALYGEDPAQDQRPPSWATPFRPLESPVSVPQFDKLYSDVIEKGRVRVIVRLKAPPDRPQEIMGGPEQEGARTIQMQHEMIARQQERVLRNISYHAAAHAKKFQFIPYMALDSDALDFFSILNSPEVDLVEQDVAVPPLLTESVPLIGADGSGTFSGFTGSGMTVAILDTGVDKTHPFLSGKVVDEACYSTTGSNSQSLCPNGQSSQVGPGAGVNCGNTNAGCYHGTHVAGIAAGKGTGMSGVAKDASIISIQVFSNSTSNSDCGGYAPCVLSWSSDQIAGLDRVYALRNTYAIAAVNMSLGGGAYSTYCDSSQTAIKAAIDNLRSVGVATVIASGNGSLSNSISAPACVSSAVSVGATTKSDVVAGYSNSASILNLLAPGSSIYSSVPGGIYTYLSGTSVAIPHVTGAWAVLKSKKPTATVDEVLAALTNTGVLITDSRNGIAKPRIKVDAALAAIALPTQILWRHTDGRVLVWYMNGTTISGTSWVNNGNFVNNVWTLVGTDDFNKDGKADILWRHADGRLLVWFMNGATISGSAWFNGGNPISNVWSLAGTADINKDGNVDILWRHTDGRLLVWYMNGTTISGSAWLNNGNPISNVWSVVGTGDFNKDGNADILWRHTDGRLIVWYMNGTAISGSAWLNNGDPVNSNWSAAGVADFNGDGSPDVLWRHTDGRVLIWYMNGTTISGTAYLNNGNTVNNVWRIAGAYVQ